MASGSEGAGGDDDELRVPAARRSSTEPGASSRRDLLGGRPKGVDQHEADGRIEGRQETVGGPAHVVAGDLGGGAQLTLEVST